MRITPILPTKASTEVEPLFDAVKAALGSVPNLMQVLAQSPAALGGYLQLNQALQNGSLPASIRERIALVTAQTNGCDYCLAAHCLLGEQAGLEPTEIERARLGTASEAKAAAAVALASLLLKNRGKVSENELAEARRAELTDSDLVEIVAHVALNTLTNFINEMAKTEIDFPAAPIITA
jgi:uncharacterized peroxidase-related enzyme